MARPEAGSLPPGPRLPRLAQSWAGAYRPLELLEHTRRKFGTRFTFRVINQPPIVLFADPADIQALFTAPADALHAGEGGDVLLPILGDRSFAMLDEDEHLYGRRVVMPSMHSSAVGRHAELIAELTEREVATWPRDVPFAVHPRLRSLILELILRFVFGPSGDDRIPELRDILLEAFSISSGALLHAPALRSVPVGRRQWSRFERRRREADEIIYSLIDEGGDELRERRYVVDLLRDANDDDPAAMTRQALRDNVMIMLLAGHETTASALAWSFQALAHNPAVRDRLTEEIEAEPDGAYLKATVYEALRYRPVFLFTIARVVKREVELAGLTLRPPVSVMGSIYSVHHDPALHPEPHRFRPERFLDQAPEGPVWLPWGGGRKRCPGLHLALLEMEIVIRTVLRGLSLEAAAPKMERAVMRSVIAIPQNQCRVILRDRRARA